MDTSTQTSKSAPAKSAFGLWLWVSLVFAFGVVLWAAMFTAARHIDTREVPLATKGAKP